VLNVNVPTCSRGKVRGVRELPPETGGASKALDPSDCTSTATPNDEIGAFLNGFAVVTRVPAQA
jgi:5'-nucleotidase